MVWTLGGDQVSETDLVAAHKFGKHDNDPFLDGQQDTLPTDWNKAGQKITLPVIATPIAYDHNQCDRVCAAHHKQHEEGCTILRKRVALYLEQNGCPSVVRAVKKAPKRPCAAKAVKKKKGCGCK